MKAAFHSLFALLALLLASCGDEAKQPNTDSDSVVHVTADSVLMLRDSLPAGTNSTVTPFGGDTTIACYYYNQGEDHRRMYVMRTGNSALGDLHINWEGKDGSIGSFIGTFSGDTLWANYDVIMEGNKMRQEIVFVMKDDKMIQGHGEQDDNGAVQTFTNKKKITFDEKRALIKGDCN